VGDGIANHVVVGGGILGDPVEFVFHVGEGLKKKLAQVGEGGGIAGGDAAFGQGFENFGEDVVVVDVGAVVEVTGQGGKLGAEFIGFEKLLFFADVEGAKAGMAFHTEHAATASIGELALTEIAARFGRICVHVDL